MILATDLDGTFLHGTKSDREKLYRMAMEEPNMILVFVTGRGLESVSSLFGEQAIPVPHYIIADVGSTIVYGKDWKPVEPIQSDIRSRWPGSLEILDALKGIEDLQYQPVPQRGRCSFWVHSTSTIEIVKQKIAHLECDLVYSNKRFLDILPRGVNKGSTLKKLAAFNEWKADEILVAGDTLNDLSLFESGYKSVIPSNAEPALLERIERTSLIYLAESEGTAGILEGLDHFQLFPGKTTQQSNRYLIG